MNLPYEWLIGTRYLRSAHRSGLVSFVASMSVIGLALGVAVLIVVLSVLNGFERELRSRMLAVTSHATITGVDGSIADWRKAQADAAREPEVVAVVPFVESRGLLANGERVAGVMVRGVLPEEEVKAKAVFGISQLLMIRAFTYAPAGVLAPFNYVQVVAAVIFGVVVFGDVPDRWTLLGIAMIIGAGIYVVRRRAG